MEDPKKNQVHIQRAESLEQKIVDVHKEVSGNFNNREMSIVATKLQEARMWVEEYKKTLL